MRQSERSPATSRAAVRFSCCIWFLAVTALSATATAQTLPQILARLGEEADQFRQLAPQVLAEETLTQRAMRPPARFKLRVGKAAMQPRSPSIATREIISEYSFGSLKDAPDSLHEFRQTVSVDGHPVSSAEKARHSLALDLTSPDDEAKKRMLEDFQKHGLTTAAVDFGPLLLLFGKRQAAHYEFKLVGDSRLGPDLARVISYRQTSGPDRMLVLEGRRAVRQPIEGQIFARVPDGLPLRITIVASRKLDHRVLREDATVDYVLNAHGFLAPAAVTHRGFDNDQLTVEDNYRYTPFKKFGADADIQFTGLPPGKSQPAKSPPASPKKEN